MSFSKISQKTLKEFNVVPIKNNIILEPEVVESDSNLVLPDQTTSGAVAAGVSVLLAKQIGSDCEKVKVGDYVITKVATTSLMKFTVVDQEYLLVNEDDVAAVIRSK